MKKLLLTIIGLILLSTPSWGQEFARLNMATIGANTVVPAGASYADILFWLNFEENDTTGDYDMGSSECSANDTSGAYVSAASIAGSGCKVGTYCFYADTSNDAMTFTGTDIVPLTKGRIGFWFKYGVWQDAARILACDDGSGNNYFFVRSNGGDDLGIRWRVGGSNECSTETTALGLTTNIWYFVELAYDTTLGATDYFDLYVNGTRVINNVGALSAMAACTLTLNNTADGVDTNAYIDNVMISSDETRTFYTDGTTDLSVTTTKPTGACP